MGHVSRAHGQVHLNHTREPTEVLLWYTDAALEEGGDIRALRYTDAALEEGGDIRAQYSSKEFPFPVSASWYDHIGERAVEWDGVAVDLPADSTPGH